MGRGGGGGDDDKKDAKKDDKKDDKPEKVESGADEKEFDGFLNGYRPDGKPRKCTDCLCLFMVGAVWALMTYWGYNSLHTGNLAKLLGGVDYDQRICGYNSKVADKTLWNIVAWDGSGKCMEECPTVSTWNQVNWFDKDDIPMLICKDQLNQTAWWADYPFFLIYFKECMFSFASTEYVTFCVLDDMTIFTNIFEQYFDFDDGYNLDVVFEQTSFLTTLAGDVWNTRYYILMFGFGVTVFFSLVYTYLMRIPIVTKTVVWGSIWGIFFFALGLAGYGHYQVGVYKVSPK